MRVLLVLILSSAATIISPADAVRNLSDMFVPGAICQLTTPAGTDSLNSAQRAGVQQAINNIRTPPPATLGYRSASGASRTDSCGSIADDLQKQLNSGRIRVDTTEEADFAGTTDMDGKTSTDGDQLVLRQSFLDSVLAGLIPWVHLEEILVHERRHKKQKADNEWDLEIPACSIEKSYKDSCGVADTNRWYKLCVDNLRNAQWAHDGEAGIKKVRYIRPLPAQGYEHFLLCDTTQGPAGVDTFTTFPWGETGGWLQFPVVGMRASDHLLFSGLLSSPPGCVRSLICGGIPGILGRIQSLCVCAGQVTLIETVRDFGPPTLPPMFFFAMTRDKQSGHFFVLDTLNQQILLLGDFDQDCIPDEIIGTYASALWPGFESLLSVRGVDVNEHLFMGRGVLANFFDAHLPHARFPHDSLLFLPDADGNLMADACVPVRHYEFTPYMPVVCVPLWSGDEQVTLLASWTHQIELWASDSTGQDCYELLDTVTMTTGGVQTFPLTRAVTAGEYVMPRDLTWEWQLSLAAPVVDPTPQGLTLMLQSNSLSFHWDAMPGADYYRLYTSYDGEEFWDSGIQSESNELTISFDPSLPMQFFRVVANRNE